MGSIDYFKNKTVTVYLFDDENDFLTGILKDCDDNGLLLKIKDSDRAINNKMVWVSLDNIESIYEGNTEKDNILELKIKKKRNKK